MNEEARFEMAKGLTIKYLPEASLELYSSGMIEDPFSYPVSDTIGAQSPYSEDILVSLNLYYLDDKGLFLCLFGIDEEGQIDLIDYAVPTENNLEQLIHQMTNIEMNAYYGHAKEWQTMG